VSVAGQLADQEADTAPHAAVARDTVAVVLSFNARESLRVVLADLAAQTVTPARTIVVDNGSTDGTAAMVASEFPHFTLVALAENAGVGAGHRTDGSSPSPTPPAGSCGRWSTTPTPSPTASNGS